MTSIDKAALSERDICTQFITPAIQQAGWDLHSQVREEATFTRGRVILETATAMDRRATGRC
jgi:type I restriction enzyme R subunit